MLIHRRNETLKLLLSFEELINNRKETRNFVKNINFKISLEKSNQESEKI